MELSLCSLWYFLLFFLQESVLELANSYSRAIIFEPNKPEKIVRYLYNNVHNEWTSTPITLMARLHGGGGPQVGYHVNVIKRVNSATWGPPPPCKQALIPLLIGQNFNFTCYRCDQAYL